MSTAVDSSIAADALAAAEKVLIQKYTLMTEVPNLEREDKIRILTKVAKTHRNCVFESGEGTTIRLDPLPADMLLYLYNFVKKRLNLP